MKRIYLDYAAATPLDQSVLKAMLPYLGENFFNPSATYLAAKAVSSEIETARSRIASWLGARKSEIVFTAGGTEANNLAIRGIMEQYPGSSIIVSGIEHDSVLKPAQLYDCRIAVVDELGLVDLTKLERQIADDTVLLSVMYANNEIGTIQPIRAISKLIAKIKEDRKKSGNDLPLFLHTDACQASAYLDLHVDRLGADMMSLNSGKIYGPKQCGALYVKSSVGIKPQILGGGQENGFRSGTENVAGIVGFAAALELVQTRRNEEAMRVLNLRDELEELLSKSIPRLEINGSRKHRLPNNLHITIPGIDNERIIMALDEAGIMCAAGSACSASKTPASHVLKAIGKSDQEAYSSLRLTLGAGTDQASVRRTAKVLAGLL